MLDPVAYGASLLCIIMTCEYEKSIEVPLERFAKNLAHLLVLPEGLELGPSKQVVIEERVDFAA